ncbi:hypothetical protein ACEQ8H_001741 [Pleosporales sp. CAS-2024a]
MTAQRIAIYTIDFPDPDTIGYDNDKFTTLNASLAFASHLNDHFQTLSTKGGDGDDPYGLLYVPSLRSDACTSEEQRHVPANATRLANLPADKNYALIALAPWFSAPCMLEYFAAARQSPTKAVLVYQPAQGDAQPPMLNDASWSLDDGGSWQRANTFPTYALSTATGETIMAQLALYSGDLADAPNGSQLAQTLAPTDYVRLWATVTTAQSSQIPSLWVFLIIVLAILIIAVSGTSAAMHVLQRRRRNHLRRRVLSGEVDLEALGVKRLSVSQQTLDKLPIYTYTAATAGDGEKPPLQPPPTAAHAPSSSTDGHGAANTSPLVQHATAPMATSTSTSTWSQPTCAICLDDFASNETRVRELPCRHIFHPDCIDTFLLRNSSLCPMCKQSVLPPGACPVKITNMMVRRERHIRRLRARASHAGNEQSDSASAAAESHTLFASLGRRIEGAVVGRHNLSASDGSESRRTDIEMADSDTISPIPATTPNRREWARQRALQMLGSRYAPANDEDETDSTPRWRQRLYKVFPGFR